MPPRDWILRVEDILDAIRRIERYTAEHDPDGFVHDERTRDAVVWNFVVIGEAARLVPPHVVERYPDVPWELMRGMRNVLVHEYFGVDDDIVWMTASRDLPLLVAPLEEILRDARGA